MNALDLAKVGKAFGFAVPPRVNVNLGAGTSSGAKKGRKRARESDEEDVGEEGSPKETMVEEEGARAQRRQGKERRIETLGRKKVEKEVYRKSKHQTGNWSR